MEQAEDVSRVPVAGIWCCRPVMPQDGVVLCQLLQPQCDDGQQWQQHLFGQYALHHRGLHPRAGVTGHDRGAVNAI